MYCVPLAAGQSDEPVGDAAEDVEVAIICEEEGSEVDIPIIELLIIMLSGMDVLIITMLDVLSWSTS